jgi:uncharacterized protein
MARSDIASWLGLCSLGLITGGGAAAQSLPDLVESARRDEALRAIVAGADVNERSVDGTTALLWAAHHGDFELVERLLARGADANARNDYGATPLGEAAVEADTKTIAALLAAGADIESPNAEGQTALMVVARTGNVATARLLLDRGADVNATEGFGGQSALMWAAAQQQPAMIRLLLERGAAVDARGRTRDWDRKVTAEPRIKIMQNGGFTALLYAAREGCVECIAALVEGGADVDLTDPDGMTPLVLALLNRNFDAAGELIERGADVNRWDWWGRSPLYLAIELNRVPASRHGDLPSLDALTGLDVARELLARGANVDMRLKNQPPLRHEPGDRGFVDGSPDALVINTGATALHAAAKAGDDLAVRLLLEHGASVDPRNVFGITPFLAAAGVGRVYGIFKEYPVLGRWVTADQAVETMKILRAAGARADERSATGLTAAHGAAQAGWSSALRYLHELGVDLGAANTAKQTPRDLAAEKDRKDTVAVIDELLAR